MKYKLILLMFVFIVCISSANAALSVLDYENDGNVAVITDWLGLGSEMARVTLLDNTAQCLVNCEANLRIDLFRDTDKPLKALKFRKYKNTNLEYIDKHYSEEVLIRVNGTEIKRVDNWIEVCETEDQNGTDVEVCRNKKNGKKDIEVYIDDWVELDKNLKLDEGTYYLKLKGKKSPSESVDWVINFMGFDLEEMAWWDTDWRYRRGLNITNSDGIHYNETINITGLDSSDTGKFNADCSDLRILCNGIEKDINITGCRTASTDINFLLDSNSSAIAVCEMYYGNTAATETSDTLHVVWDDFNHDSGWWNAYELPGGTAVGCATIVSGHLQVIHNGGADDGTWCFYENNMTGSDKSMTIQLQSKSWSRFLNVFIDSVLDAGAAEPTISNSWMYINDLGTHATGIYQDLEGSDSDGDTWVAIVDDWGNFEMSLVDHDGATNPTMFANWTEMLPLAVGENLGYEFTAGAAVAHSQNGTFGFGTSLATSNGYGFWADNFCIVNRDYSCLTYDVKPIYELAGEEDLGYEEFPYTIYSTIFDQPAYINDTLNCSVRYFDSEKGSTGTVHFTWYKNNENNYTFNNDVAVNNVINGTIVYSDLVVEGLSIGDTWMCSTNATNLTGGKVINNNSTLLTIESRIPSTPTILLPENSTLVSGASVDLNCSGAVDPDGDDLYYELFGDSGVSPPTTLLQNTTTGFYTWALDNSVSNTFYYMCYATDGNGTRSEPIGDYLVNYVDFFNCTGSGGIGASNVSLNFSMYDELDFSNLTGDMKFTFDIWGTDPAVSSEYSVYERNVSTGVEGGVRFCISPTDQTINLNAIIEYYGAGGYDVRNYYLNNLVVTNDTQEFKLYSLLIDYADGITFHVSDEVDNPYGEVIIKVQKYDVGTGNYNLVAMGKTNTEGEAHIYLRKFDSQYIFVIESGGVDVYTTEQTQIIDDDIYIRITTTTTSDVMKLFKSVSYSLSFNNVTNIYSVIFSDLTGSVRDHCLRVVRNSRGGQTEEYNGCETTTSGTISHTISGEDGSYLGSYYIKANPVITIDSISYYIGSRLSDDLGLDGVVIMALIIIVISLVGIFNPVVMVILSLIGLIVSMALGLAVISSLAFGGILALGIILIFRLKT